MRDNALRNGKKVDLGSLWFEKYRPRSLADMVLPDKTRRYFQAMLDSGDMPHLLLVGSVGSGKTTTARILMAGMDAETRTFNASDERGIDVMRQKVQDFVRTMGYKRLKIVFLDEADGITPDAQAALRSMMETYDKEARFILAANYPNRIIEALHSRCQTVTFDELGRKAVFALLARILKAEGVAFDDEALASLVGDYYPDVRGMINQAQRLSVGGRLAYEEKLGVYNAVLSAIKSPRRDFAAVRKAAADVTDCVAAMDWLLRHADEFASPAKAFMVVAEHMYRQAFMPIKEVGFAHMCLELMGVGAAK